MAAERPPEPPPEALMALRPDMGVDVLTPLPAAPTDGTEPPAPPAEVTPLPPAEVTPLDMPLVVAILENWAALRFPKAMAEA